MSDEKRWGLINEMYGKFNSGQDLTKLDVTFGELDRDTQLRLVSHVLDGGDVEHFFDDEWVLKHKIILPIEFYVRRQIPGIGGYQMKIKTKRGARRIRNQRVIDRRFVVTDYDRCSYITAGKLYRLYDGYQIIDNQRVIDSRAHDICIGTSA